MKKQVLNKLGLNRRNFLKTFICPLICGTLILSAGCTKKEPAPVIGSVSMNSQEQALVGKWALKKTETYEITGTDSVGHYLCNLIASSTCDSSCKITFNSDHSCPKY